MGLFAFFYYGQDGALFGCLEGFQEHQKAMLKVQTDQGTFLIRTKASMRASSWAYIDIDGIPEMLSNDVVLRGLRAIYYELENIQCSIRRSTSSDIYSVADDKPRKDSYGLRVYFMTDTPEALKPLFQIAEGSV